ncbi:hypothetical protein B9Y85_00360 [Stenotrophomonas maltophilia]|uniref:Uncharacterized protein n=1 Tax=Stenotrophomonas maltophilia TaxID=40324 RepID=A0A2J0T1K8_STEMA|nr:hypothetical protein [Stenotrophomonas maltophilia]PJL04267.1 hypothetical protein B9Y57_10290 [Stenotrophomonas maltophilia]PJL30863.1 hypothetical protein B9Y65_10290 [Stenotrophomonas maltophilia]PJL68999.1 hypothetical protein B9Y85_00360 [Stenotrophomonas maltophilia]
MRSWQRCRAATGDLLVRGSSVGVSGPGTNACETCCPQKRPRMAVLKRQHILRRACPTSRRNRLHGRAGSPCVYCRSVVVTRPGTSRFQQAPRTRFTRHRHRFGNS